MLTTNNCFWHEVDAIVLRFIRKNFLQANSIVRKLSNSTWIATPSFNEVASNIMLEWIQILAEMVT